MALTAFIAWTLALLVLMEAIRSKMVLARQVPPNGFVRITRTSRRSCDGWRARTRNCLEGLPIFGGLMIVALVTQRAAVTDPLAWALLAARVLQSSIHLASTSPAAVTLRFTAFAVQLVIAIVWSFRLLAG